MPSINASWHISAKLEKFIKNKQKFKIYNEIFNDLMNGNIKPIKIWDQIIVNKFTNKKLTK